MDFVNNYKEYKKYYPDYEAWRNSQELNRAKRLEYVKRNPNQMNKEDVQRGKILLHAIDVMDEYSQSNAEDMEVATEFATGQVVGISTGLGMLAGLPIANLKSVKRLAGKISKNVHGAGMVVQMLPSVIGMLIGTAVSFPVIAWATKTKVSASRHGRFEAMRKDLSNPAIFAVLTPEQMKKAEADAKNIELDEKVKKRLDKKTGMGINPTDSFRTLRKYYSKDGEYIKQKAEFNKKLKESEKNFNTQLSEYQINKAKKDQQILADMVRKIDIASQDYAENAELATNTLTSLALGTGGLVGWASNKLLKLLKVKTSNPVAKFIPWIVGASIPLVMAIYSAKIQKQASRIGRFKAKQEMMNNPEGFVYVDDKNLSEIKDVKAPEKTKKPNIFQFFGQLVKDNKEYNKYRKTELINDLKLQKAIEKIDLSDEQLKDAKALQMNVFKTFNKVDEKSQTYSESVEAMGEMTKQGVSLFGSLAAMGVSMMSMLKMLEHPESIQKSSIAKTIAKSLTPFAFVLLPVIAIDVYTTKAQKKASRVADMMALKDLEDYRHYVDYSEVNKK